MVQCKKCGKDHDGTYGSGSYCSPHCARSRIFSEESKKKTSETLKKAHAKGEITTDLTKWILAGAEQSRKRKEERYTADFDTLCWDSKRLRVIREQQSACSKCGLSEWMGQKLTLEVDHKDGDRKNNSRENLEALCPNCHSLTPTWRGRNNKNKRVK